MPLPSELKNALASLFNQEGDVKKLTEKAGEISAAYREHEKHPLTADEHTLAYLATRLPATYAATQKVLQEIAGLPIASLLELGSGAGVAVWAAAALFPNLKNATLIERNPRLIKWGQRLTHEMDLPIDWQQKNLHEKGEFPPADLVFMGYVSGELPEKYLEPIIKNAYQAAKCAFIILEPGTPRGYQRILKIRDWILKWGGHILAPCSHQEKCPLKGADWCHFSVRLERSWIHKTLKQADMGYEDEKFSYLIAAPSSLSLPVSFPVGQRILKPPRLRTGHAVLALCAPNAVSHSIITRKEGRDYKKARKAEWGDLWIALEEES